MSQENQGTNSSTPGNLPVKRKRGRPRKDERTIQGDKLSGTPGSDIVKRNRSRKIEPAPSVPNAMVGQVVSGVLDGKFDAGYLLTVRVGDSNTILRGVVFEPGLSVPVSGANDVAPHIKMLKRNETPHPVVHLQTQMHGSNHQSQQQQTVKPSQRNVDPIPLMAFQTNQIPKSATHVLSSQLQTKPMASAEVRNDTNHVPQAASQTLQHGQVKDKTSGNPFDGERLGEFNEVIQVSCQAADSMIEKKKPSDISTKQEADHLPKEGLTNNGQTALITPEQTAQSGLETESAAVTQTSPLEHSTLAKSAELLPKNEMPSLSECPQDVGDVSKDMKLKVPNTDSSVEILLPSKMIDQVLQGGSDAVDSECKPDQQNYDALKDKEVEPEHTIVAVAPVTMASLSVKMLQEDPLSDIEFKFPVEMPRADETSHSNERESIEAVKVIENDLQSEPRTNQEVEMLQEEAIPTKPNESVDERGMLARDIPESLTPEPDFPTKLDDCVRQDTLESQTFESTLQTKEDDFIPRDAPESRTLESTLPTKEDDCVPHDAPESQTLETTLPTNDDYCITQDTAPLPQSMGVLFPRNPEESNSYTDFL